MLHSRYIVVEDFPDGKTEVLYNGPDSAKAQAALTASTKRGQADAVILFAHPPTNQLRYPAEEKKTLEERAKAEERTAEQAANAKKIEAAGKREKAKQLTAEAKRLEAEAAAHDETEKEK